MFFLQLQYTPFIYYTIRGCVMIDLLINLLLLLFIYMAVFLVYYMVCVFFSSKARRFVVKQKYQQSSMPNNIVLIIYAHNDESTIVPLLESLNKQNYPKENYQIHIILDNCTDNSSNILEFVGGAKIWRVGDDTPVGKDEAVSWLLERLLSFQNIDAFAFLSADRYVDSNFLNSISAALYDEKILVGSTDYLVKNKTLTGCIKASYHTYMNRIFNIPRSLMGLAAIVDSDVFIIKQEVLEKIKCVDFQDSNSDLKYTTLLVRNNFIPKYNPTIRTFTQIENYRDKKPSASFKLGLCWHCLKLMPKSNIRFVEFIANTLAPSFWLLTLIYAILFIFTYNYYFIIDFWVIVSLGVLSCAAFGVSLYLSKMNKESLLHLLAYPAYSLIKLFLHIPLISSVSEKVRINKQKSENFEMTTVPVQVTDGKNNLQCKLDLISESGLVKAVFRFKKKKYSSSSQIRMLDAIKDISDKLNEHGFRLKICQSCGYFNLNLDGSTNMVKGYCNRLVVQKTAEEPMDTILWNACPFYLPQEVNKVIDINTFKDNS